VTNKYDLTTEAVVAYEAQKVVSIFKPLAEATMDKVNVDSDASVIDIACGTGIIGRTIRHRYGQGPALTGVDLSSEMISKAKSLSEPLGGRFSWIVGDAMEIPVADRVHTMCFCQQGIQYMPDDSAAIGEMARVLAVGGQLVIAVWGPANAYFQAQAAAMGRHVGNDWAAKAVAPFAYRGDERLPQLMANLGLDNISVEQISIDRIIRDAETGVAEDIEGSPLLPAFRAAPPETRALIVENILSDCVEFKQGNDLIIPQHCHLITGRRM
jgi:ubiquinone/menaquinone biosynthesis C-methylase UbiE